ncbi:hypothetical protein [Promicromonospora sp. NPDC023805]|uniref:hypothetical protein n=1 Tax=Promicromonospora sp. NPDC023805 TaxID=3154696 RepID=UPI0033FACA63
MRRGYAAGRRSGPDRRASPQASPLYAVAGQGVAAFRSMGDALLHESPAVDGNA